MLTNWFKIMAAVMAAAMKSPRNYKGGTRGIRGPGRHNPPGSKVLRRAYKAKHEGRGTYEQARNWYSNLADGRYKAGHQRSVTGQPLKF